jgi:gliding motility associated protien GldN
MIFSVLQKNKNKNMKTLVKILSGVVLTSVLSNGIGFAQEKDNKGINPLSVREINEADIMMKRTLWRRIDLKEKANQPLFSEDNQITKYIIDAMKAGLLDAYDDDKLAKKMTLDQFNKRLTIPAATKTLTAEEIKAGFSDDPAKDAGAGWDATSPKKDAGTQKPTANEGGWGATDTKKPAEDNGGWGATPAKKGKGKGKKGAKTAIAPSKPAIDSTEIKRKQAEEAAAALAAAAEKESENQYYPSDLTVMQIKEDRVFDRKRSRLYYDIQTITIYVSAEVNPIGLEVPVATFKYKDLDKLFRSDPKKFIWFNEYNTAQHKNLADAFDLRLFEGRIVKYSNAKNQDLTSIYGGDKQALWKSIQLEEQLMEEEHNLWEY